MKGAIASLVLCVAWLPADVVTSPRDTQPPTADDVQDLVFLAEEKPIFIRMHIQVDGRSFRQAYAEAWRAYVTQLFRQLDHEGSGSLSESAAALLPPAQPALRPGRDSDIKVNTAFNFRVVDADGDGKLSLAEVLDYYQQYGGHALQTHFAQASLGGVDGDRALFTQLDKNRDGKLTEAELKSAAALLPNLDLDGDELLTSAEILRQARRPAVDQSQRSVRQARNSQTPRSPFLVPALDQSREALATQLRARYPSPDKAISTDDPVMRVPDVEITLRLGKRVEATPALEVLPSPKGSGAISARVSSTGSLLISAGRILFELTINDSRPTLAAASRQQFLNQFRAADESGKGFLTAKDAQEHNFYSAHFALLDQNADGKLTEQELLTYLDEVQPRQALAATCATIMLISEEGRGLFDLLDRNRDGRLSLRELRAAPQLLALLGREKEGFLTADDLPRSYRIAVGLCDAAFDHFGGRGTFSPRGIPLLTLDGWNPGLAWFDQMDRNHDGDISRREFLGSPELFDRLDADGDGLISLEEARRATRTVTSTPSKAPRIP